VIALLGAQEGPLLRMVSCATWRSWVLRVFSTSQLHVGFVNRWQVPIQFADLFLYVLLQTCVTSMLRPRILTSILIFLSAVIVMSLIVIGYDTRVLRSPAPG